MTVVIASDHAGLLLRESLIQFLGEQAHPYQDLGPQSRDSVDYPDFALAVCKAVLAKPGSLGVLVCGTGIGMSMVANKVHGIRAALCTNEFEARQARAHNDANVLCVGERVIGAGVARGILQVFLETPFEGGRHLRRLAKIRDVEAAQSAQGE